ncbi:MAG TPA: fibronectin type III domain-containing protein, partial [Bacteroidales bacterium]|nr:fibronectin type III domain-containing protein [Bacteroidales bacterium]
IIIMNLKFCFSLFLIAFVSLSINPDIKGATPVQQAYNISFSSVKETSFTVKWLRGSGSKCVVFVKQTSSGTASPVNKTTYKASTVFGSGSQIGTSKWYCVYNGTGTSVTITGLTVGKTYRVMVCEYNGTNGSQEYLTTSASKNPANQAPDYTWPTIQAKNLTFSNISSTSITASWTRGNGSQCILFVKQTNSGTASPVNNTTYSANNTFGSGSQIGTSGWYCLYKGTGKSVVVNGLTPGTTYQFMTCEFNGSNGFEKYLTSTTSGNPAVQTTITATPTIQASKVSFANVTANSFNLSWTRGNGSNCAVFVTTNTTSSLSLTNNTTYVPNNVYGLGTQVGTSGWYCVYTGSGTNINVTGLKPGVTYKAMVCEFNGNASNEKYLVSTTSNNPNTRKTIAITTWDGTSWDNGKPNPETNAVVNADLKLNENIVCNDLIINAGKNLTINAGYCLTVQNNITNNGYLILKSPLSEASSAMLINYGDITNNGTMTAERYITPGTSLSSNKVWHNMSSPVGSFKVEKSFFGDYVSQYVESTNGWKALVSGNLITPTTGYIVKTIQTGGKTINFTGTFNTGNQSVALTNTGADANHGYNLVGNPYPSAIDWEASSGWTKTNISRTIWIWNPYTQVYSTWDGTVGTNGGSRYIPAMQGFIVKVNEGYTTGALAMNNNVRVYNTKSYSKKAKTEPELIRLKTSGNELSDELIV